MDQSEARKAASHEWPATVAQWVFSLGRGWFAYIAEFDVWLWSKPAPFSLLFFSFCHVEQALAFPEDSREGFS